MEELDFIKKENQELKNKNQELKNKIQELQQNSFNDSSIISLVNKDKKNEQDKYIEGLKLGKNYLNKLKEENPEHYNLIIENT